MVDVSEGTPQVMKYPRKGSFEISYMLREEGHTFAKEVTSSRHPETLRLDL